MKLNKITAIIAAMSIFTTGLFAQDEDFSSWNSFDEEDYSSWNSFDSDDDFSSTEGSEDDFSSFGDDDFGSWDGGDDFGSFSGSSSSSLPITFNGKLSLDTRYYFAKDDSKYFIRNFVDTSTFSANDKLTTATRLWARDHNGEKVYFTDATLKAMPKAKLGIEYSGNMADASLTLNFTKDTLKDYHEDIVDELIIRGYFMNSHLTVEAGKMKIVWGKGDKLHVLDNFNADDYTDFIIPDYIDRRISTPMIRAVYSFDTPSPLSIEGVFTPFMAVDRFAKKGMWTPASYAKLSGVTTGVVEAWDDLAKAAKFDEDDMYPDTNNIKYAQAGVHVTGTVGSFDWGAMYYFGSYKSPSANLENMFTDVLTAQTLAYMAQQTAAAGNTTLAATYAAQAANAKKNIRTPKLDYNRKHTIGAEFATIVGRFNLRGEAAYNWSGDWDGDDPWVHNNSFQWLFGFDFDIPISNININVQETGTFILQDKKIKEGKFADFDVDRDKKDRYTNDKLVVLISDSLMHDKLKPEIALLWGIERCDVVVMPKVTYAPTPELSFALSGMYIYCRDKYSEFYEWKNNRFINLNVTFQF